MKLILTLLLSVILNTAFAQQIDAPAKNAPESLSIPSDTTPEPQPPRPSSDLAISGAYVQPLIPGQHNTAAYMLIQNNSKETFVLNGVYSPIAQRTELHTILMENSVMKMREVPDILIPPGQSVRLQPGALHIMLIGIETLPPDMEVPLILSFKNSADVELHLPVRDKRGENASQDVHMGHDHAH